MAPTPGTQLNLSFVSTASKDRLRRVTASRNKVAVSRAVLLLLFFLAFFWSSWLCVLCFVGEPGDRKSAGRRG